MRMIATSASLALILGLAACGDKEDDVVPLPPPPADPEDPDDTDDTDNVPMGSELAIEFSFYTGIDYEAGTTTSVTTPDGATIPSQIEILFSSDLWDDDFANTDEYCYILIDVGNEARASWTDAEGRWFSYDLQPTTFESSCDGFKYELEDLFGLSEFGISIGEYYATLSYAVGLGGEMDPAIAAAMEGAQIDPEEYIAGYFRSYFVDPDSGQETNLEESPIYGIGVQVDENMAMVLDDQGNLVFHDSSSAYQPDGMSSGYYEQFSYHYWRLTL